MSVIRDRFQALGWRVFCVPEAATTLFGGGVSFGDLDHRGQIIFQVQLMKVMFALEDAFYLTAKATRKKSLIICDRGAMDASAYIDAEGWQSILDDNGWQQMQLRDSRYDCVIHLTTSADGAESFYGSDTNSTRLETPEEARALDARMKQCWLGHPYLYMIDNSTDFFNKIGRAVEAVSKFIGAYEPGIIKRKFLVRSAALDDESAFSAATDFPVSFHDSVVLHDFIKTSDNSHARLRARGNAKGGEFVYTLTFRVKAADDPTGIADTQLRRTLSGIEYAVYLTQRDPALLSVEKRRRSFVYKNTNFELDTFVRPAPTAGLRLLEAYLPETMPLADCLPPFITVEREVTHDAEYKLRRLASPAVAAAATTPSP